MKLGNRRGIADLVVLLCIALAVIGGIVIGPIAKSFVGLGGQPQKQKVSVVKKVESVPVVYYRDERGIEHVAMATKTYESTLDASEDRQPTLWQKFKLWIVVLGGLVIAFPSIGVWLYAKLRQAKVNLTQLVVGIEQARKEMPPEAVAKLENNLSKKMDSRAKIQVKAIKADLIKKEV